MDSSVLGPLLAGIPTGTVSGWVLVAVVVLALVKAWPALRKLQIEEDGSLRSELMARITRLETDLSKERSDCANLIAELRKDYEARIGAQGRQIDVLQREIFELRRSALHIVEAARTGSDLTALVQQFDGTGDHH